MEGAVLIKLHAGGWGIRPPPSRDPPPLFHPMVGRGRVGRAWGGVEPGGSLDTHVVLGRGQPAC